MVLVSVTMVTVCPQAGPWGEGQWNETPQTRDPEHGQQQPQHWQLQTHSGENTHRHTKHARVNTEHHPGAWYCRHNRYTVETQFSTEFRVGKILNVLAGVHIPFKLSPPSSSLSFSGRLSMWASVHSQWCVTRRLQVRHHELQQQQPGIAVCGNVWQPLLHQPQGGSVSQELEQLLWICRHLMHFSVPMIYLAF